MLLVAEPGYYRLRRPAALRTTSHRHRPRGALGERLHAPEESYHLHEHSFIMTFREVTDKLISELVRRLQGFRPPNLGISLQPVYESGALLEPANQVSFPKEIQSYLSPNGQVRRERQKRTFRLQNTEVANQGACRPTTPNQGGQDPVELLSLGGRQ